MQTLLTKEKLIYAQLNKQTSLANINKQGGCNICPVFIHDSIIIDRLNLYTRS